MVNRATKYAKCNSIFQPPLSTAAAEEICKYAASALAKSKNNSEGNSLEILDVSDAAADSPTFNSMSPESPTSKINSSILKLTMTSPVLSSQVLRVNVITTPLPDVGEKTESTTPTTTNPTPTTPEPEVDDEEEEARREAKQKEIASLHHQYGELIQKQSKKFSIRELRAERSLGILNKACQLRLACSRKLRYSDVSHNNPHQLRNLGKISKADSTLRIMAPWTSFRFSGRKKPVRFNRTTEMRYLYSHLPYDIRKRFGVFETVAPDTDHSTAGSPRKGVIDGIKYEIEEIKYDFNDPRLSSRNKSQKSDNYKLAHTTLRQKWNRERALRLKRENRLKSHDKLPFRLQSKVILP